MLKFDNFGYLADYFKVDDNNDNIEIDTIPYHSKIYPWHLKELFLLCS